MTPEESANHTPDPTLTNAAAQLLDDHLDATRNRVLQEILRVNKQENHPQRVRAADVDEAIRRLSVADARMHYLGVFRRANRAITFIAISLAVVGFITWSLSLEQEGGSWIGLPLGISMGATFVILSEFISQAPMRRRSRAAANSIVFLQHMTQLEIDARNFVAREAGIDAAQGSLALVFDTLVDRRIWSSEDVNNFRLLLRLRNSIVHEQKLTLPEEALGEALQQVDRLRDVIPKWPRIPMPRRRREASSQ
ncbi:hypothetical protein [Salinispora arenicola]|uniref:hypothetical protein n=1 Tax=Salinispora arenicola TaxID=168697 RepID=UPI00207A59B4|nr:hypothetical protein [Salinispora arenicola]MCN0178656.1 hypothetical protein [Salinispora arenicola]